jgi:tetratricopeptide (TPR) repeat protein
MRKVPPQPSQNNLAKAADKLYQLGKYSECIAECRLALKKAPKNLILLDLCALSYLLTGQEDACVASYLEILQIDPGNFIANLNIGKIFINQGKHSQALTFLDKCLIESDQLSNVRLMIGICHEMTSNYSEAINCYSLILNHEPHKISAYVQLASALFKIQQKKRKYQPRK